MSFPLTAYQSILAEAQAIVEDRCKKGRNTIVPWREKFIHGHSDVIYEIHERVCRIRGAEAVNDLKVLREDALDLVNEAAFLVVLLDLAQDSSHRSNPTTASLHREMDA